MSNGPPDRGPGGSRLKRGKGPRPRWLTRPAFLFTAAVLTCGCTSWREYVNNGFKVGPNYEKPPAPVAKDWINADDQRVRKASDDLSQWWTVFNDPALNALICDAYRQNRYMALKVNRAYRGR